MVVSLAKPPINIFLQIMGRVQLEPNLRTLLSSNLNNQKKKKNLFLGIAKKGGSFHKLRLPNCSNFRIFWATKRNWERKEKEESYPGLAPSPVRGWELWGSSLWEKGVTTSLCSAPPTTCSLPGDSMAYEFRENAKEKEKP